MNRKSLPGDEAGVGEMIAVAFDRMPEPETARLKAIEDRLAIAGRRRESTRRRGWYWWLILGLAASATAAWWAGDYFSGEISQNRPAQYVPVPAGEHAHTGSAEAAPERNDDSSSAGSPTQTGKEPGIYRRERY